jgi:hypothetical protein
METHLRTNELENKVDALIAEFRKIVNKSSHLLANPGLRRCRAIVELDPITRVPIRQQTRFETYPRVLNDGADVELLKLRYGYFIGFLELGRNLFVDAWATGSPVYEVSLHDVTDPDAPYPCHVELTLRDTNGRKAHFGLGV